MRGLRLAGTLWIVAGVVCAGLFIVVFVGERINDLGALLRDPVRPALVFGGMIVALPIGSLLVTRPGPNVVRWSNYAGVAWLIGFGALVVEAVANALGGGETGPIVSSSLITSFGVAGALVASWSRRRSVVQGTRLASD